MRPSLGRIYYYSQKIASILSEWYSTIREEECII